jgi:hypothetical protein
VRTAIESRTIALDRDCGFSIPIPGAKPPNLERTAWTRCIGTYGEKNRPSASTMVQVVTLTRPELLLEINAVAVIP